VNIIELTVPAAAQPIRDGVAPLSAAQVGAGRVGQPASWPAAASSKRPRLGGRSGAGFALATTLTAVTKPGHRNIRNHTYMTRVNADGDGGSGSHAWREQPA
jgi:hypothetical protein